jgi:hypothetical protein
LVPRLSPYRSAEVSHGAVKRLLKAARPAGTMNERRYLTVTCQLPPLGNSSSSYRPVVRDFSKHSAAAADGPIDQ